MRISERSNGETKGFEGVIHAINLNDVIQMECLAMSHRAVRVEAGENVGRLYFAGGQVVHAEVGPHTGEEAFFEILSWPGGGFRIEDGRRAPDETITRNWESLLMEAAHRHDEIRDAAATVTAFPLTATAMTHDPIAEAFKDPEIHSGVHFATDGTLLQSKGEDPETLQGTFAYVVQLLQHIGTSIGAENLREVHLVGTDGRAVCVVVDELTTAAVTSPKANLVTLAAKLS